MLKEASGEPVGRSRWAGGIDLAARLHLQLLNARAEAARQPKAAHAAALLTYVSHLYRQRVRSQGTKLCVHTAAVAAERLLALTAQLSIRRCRHSIASQELIRADVECVHWCAVQEEDNNEWHAQQRLRYAPHRAVAAKFARVKKRENTTAAPSLVEVLKRKGRLKF